MISAISAFALSLCQAPKVADFFPSTLGTAWTYEETSGVRSTYVDTVIPSVEFGGEPAISIKTTTQTKVGSEVIGVTHYKIQADTVYAIAFQENVVLSDPHPILKIGASTTTWEYKGHTPLSSILLPMEFKATSTWKPKQLFFGEERDCIEVKMTAKINEVTGYVTTKIEQVCTYAKGLGMVSMQETSTHNKTISKRSVKLIKFELPK